jgi:hypothetical protein
MSPKTADGRVAAMLDGTIRWFRVDNGREVIALFPHRDRKRWLLWTPDGYFDAAEGGEELVGYHTSTREQTVRRRFVSLNNLYDVFYRPDIVQAAFRGEDTGSLISITAQQALASPPPKVSFTSSRHGQAGQGKILLPGGIPGRRHRRGAHLPQRQADPFRRLLPGGCQTAAAAKDISG